MMKAHVVLSRGLKECVRAFNICLQKGRRIGNRIVVMAFRRKVHTGVRLRKEFLRQRRITDIAMHEGHAIL